MISLFNIPCDSPIEFYKLPPSKMHFSFPLSPEENLMIAKLGGQESRNSSAKYLADGRKTIGGGRPLEPLSSGEAWKILIIRSQLLIRFNSTLKLAKPSVKPFSNVRTQGTQIIRRHAFRISFKKVAESLRKYK